MSEKKFARRVNVWGGLGIKKSNSGTQFYQQDRIYDAYGICPALSAFKADYWIVIKDEKHSNTHNRRYAETPAEKD